MQLQSVRARESPLVQLHSRVAVLQAKVFLAFMPVHEPETALHRNARLAGLKDITTILHRCRLSWGCVTFWVQEASGVLDSDGHVPVCLLPRPLQPPAPESHSSRLRGLPVSLQRHRKHLKDLQPFFHASGCGCGNMTGAMRDESCAPYTCERRLCCCGRPPRNCQLAEHEPL